MPTLSELIEKLRDDAKASLKKQDAGATLEDLAARVGYENATSLSNGLKPEKVGPAKLVALWEIAEWSDDQVVDLIVAYLEERIGRSTDGKVRTAWRLARAAERTVPKKDLSQYRRFVVETFAEEARATADERAEKAERRRSSVGRKRAKDS